MKRIISFLILVVFLSSQTAAYAQQIGYTSPGSNLTSSRRVIKMNKVSKTSGYEAERDKAMTDAIFRAEYDISEKAKSRPAPTKPGPIRGKREQAIIDKYRKQQLREMEDTIKDKFDLRTGKPIAKKAIRKKIPRKDIPRGADLGKGLARRINQEIYPFKISGEYQAAWGYDWGSSDGGDGHGTIWKSADFNKANMVYVLDSQYTFSRDRENTYDKRIYDRFRMKLETVRERGLNFLSEITVDPWSFVGKTDFFMINGPAGQIPLQLRYWSNTQHTLDERIWLTSGTDFVNIPEIKVESGNTHPASVTSRFGAVYDIPELDINRDFRPLRKLEAGYKSDYMDLKIFPLADVDHAYTTDDPLMLSNKHTYWEPSPWLNRWDPALYFPATGDFRRGSWRNDISFESRDSDYNYLTLLRGLSLDMNFENTYIGGAIATPLTLWQDYGNVNSLPAALRLKQTLFDNYYIGTTYAGNYGFDERELDAFNHVAGIDAGFEIEDLITFRGEYARSRDRIDWDGHEPQIARKKADGSAYRIEGKGEFIKDEAGDPAVKVGASYTRMDDEFNSRLSNYRNTRKDENWGKHISFKEVAPEYDHFRIGDGIDIGREVYSFRLENMLFRQKFNSLFDMRFVNGPDGKLENVYREEITIAPIKNLATKFLYRFQDLPRTTFERDPYIITDYVSGDNTDEYLINEDVAGEEDADVWTYSAGVHYDPVNWLGFETIYERTNDFDIFPQLCLNDANFRDLGNVRELSYFLYDQMLIAKPPYNAYSIYKTRLFWTPFDYLRAKFEYVINIFKHATGRDDNISHYGIELDMDLTKKLHCAFKFTRSQLVDLYQQTELTDMPFYHHNNLFGQLEYTIDANNSFIAQFGEFYVPTEHTPVPWMLNTVDTQRIIRCYLKGRF